MNSAVLSVLLFIVLISPALGQLGSLPDSPLGSSSSNTTTTGNITNTTDTNTSVPVTSPPAPTLKPALIYPSRRGGDPNSPLTGTPPANLKKAVITKHIYGGAVEFRKGRDGNGCPCRERVPEKHRYDIELKDRPKKEKKCKCAKKKQGKKGKRESKRLRKAGIPPVVAKLYPQRRRSGRKGKKGKRKLKPCKKEHKKKKAHITPEYKPAKAKKHKKNCKKHKKKKATIAPEFYPPRRHHKHKGKIVKKVVVAPTSP